MTGAELNPFASFRLDGKVAAVTGAGAGLGRRFARVLDAAGAKVMIVARRRDRLEQLADELSDALVWVGQLPQAGDAASKGGIVALTRELSAQWARKGIRVNALAPGWSSRR